MMVKPATPEATAPAWGIAELAREFGVSTRTVRFYEDKGLIAPRRIGQRRVYGPRDRVRLKLIMRGKRLGFSLEEIRQMIDLYDADSSEVKQLRLFLQKIGERRASLIGQRDDIAAILAELDEFEARSRALLAKKHTGGEPAPA